MRRSFGLAAASTAIGAMVATAFFPTAGVGRRRLTPVVVGSLFASTTAAGTARWGWRRATASASAVVGATLAVEAVGSRWGRPFGRYAYTGALRPQVAGVPVVVPLAWAAMALPARETAHAALGRRSTCATRVVGGALALTAWDLFLDPQMVGEGYWAWPSGGRYRGVPLSNFAGWFAVGLGLMALLEVTAPLSEPDPALVGTYATMATMETAAFASFLADRVVAVVGAVGMLPVAAVGVGRLVGQRP